ncbi:helix-hairpin-helix domain-containing protein, partial [Frankia sp. AvcI1]
LAELQEALELPDAPLRIECYDVSNIQGTNVVASMVVFEDGLARKSEYRRFSIRGGAGGAGREHGRADAGQDDVASMYETIHRRFSRYLAERSRTGELVDIVDSAEDLAADTGVRDGRGRAVTPGAAQPIDPDTGRPRRFAYPPNLVVVDGGPPQVAAAARALDELGIDTGPGGVALCGLAKRLEEVWLPDSAEPVILPRTSEALYLLQRVRDEAHRFAITYHRQKRSAAMVTSALDDVPGLGETRRKALLRQFGSVAKVRAASAEEIAQVPGIGPRTAAAILTALGRSAPGTAAAPAPAVDPRTGEILDGAPPASPVEPDPARTAPAPAADDPAAAARALHPADSGRPS